MTMRAMAGEIHPTYAVIMTSRAERDRAGIYEEINAENSEAALKWYWGLKESVFSLERLPHRCSAIRKKGQIRQLLYGAKPHVYLVLYRIVEKQKLVQVLHIRHGARQRFSLSDLASWKQ